MGLTAAQIASVFDACFGDSHAVCCIGGATEPLYVPASRADPAQLHFRGDFAASALHEISHWCLAGARRRRLLDFGYSYVDAPRSLVDQVKFLSAEVLPQALESVFARAAAVPFRYSFDDVDDRFVMLRPGFRAAVATRHGALQRSPQLAGTRAERFCAALAAGA